MLRWEISLSGFTLNQVAVPSTSLMRTVSALPRLSRTLAKKDTRWVLISLYNLLSILPLASLAIDVSTQSNFFWLWLFLLSLYCVSCHHIAWPCSKSTSAPVPLQSFASQRLLYHECSTKGWGFSGSHGWKVRGRKRQMGFPNFLRISYGTYTIQVNVFVWAIVYSIDTNYQ